MTEEDRKAAERYSNWRKQEEKNTRMSLDPMYHFLAGVEYAREKSGQQDIEEWAKKAMENFLIMQEDLKNKTSSYLAYPVGELIDELRKIGARIEKRQSIVVRIE